MDMQGVSNRNDSSDFQTQNDSGYQNINYLNGTYLSVDKNPYIPTYMYILVSVINAFIFIFGLVGNILVIFVIVKSRSMRTATNFFLLSLSIADILVLLFCQPAALMEFYAKDRWLIGKTMCKMVPLLENGALSVSILTMLAVTAERYIAICHPFKRNIICTTKATTKIILIAWLLGFLLSSPFLLMTDIENAFFYDGTPIVVCRTRVNTLLRKMYIIFVFVVFFALPVLILTFTYCRIMKQLISDSLKLFGSSNDRSAQFTLRLRKQVVRMLIIIVSLFFISLCPIRIVTLWLIFTPTKKIVSIGLEAYLNLISFARIMMYINSAGNPLIYNLTSHKFKTAFRSVLQRFSSRSTSMSRRHAINQNKPDAQGDGTNINHSAPRLIVRLLLYSGKDEPNNDPGQQQVVNEVFPLHVIYEEESTN